METALHAVEVIHWVALAFMGTVYTVRLLWLFKFNAGRDRQLPGDRGRNDLGPAMYSVANVTMPWAMESTRGSRGFGFWVSFVVFHLGVAVGIFLAVFSSLVPALFQDPRVAQIFMAILGTAFLVGLGRIVRRLTRPVLRLISTPDDYFSVFMLTGWFLTGVLAQAHIAGYLPDPIHLVVFLAATSFFLVYVPFSKISHYLYYPFARYYLGKTLGHRGSLRPARS
jgi:nitrate reductase gamma subunit